MSDTRKYRKFTAQRKTEIVLASLRGPKSMSELCREHDIADSRLRKWREQFLAAGAERLSGKQEHTAADRAAPADQPARVVAQGRLAAVVARVARSAARRSIGDSSARRRVSGGR